jgi:CBS domain-containing protein
MAMQTVSEVMTRNVHYVSPQESVRHAAQMMDDLNVGALPVCDGERLVGMVTDRDITVRATSAGMAPDDVFVDQVMSTDVRWCFEDQPLDEVMQQMAGAQIRRVPVVSHDDAHKLVGIVSLGDVATKSDGKVQKQHVEQAMERISFPSEPDRSSQDATAGSPGMAASDTGTATGLAGSDILDDRMNPGRETSSTADPSDMVEVAPDDLVNRNAPGSNLTAGSSVPDRGTQEVRKDGVIVRHTTGSGKDATTGETGAPAGIDAAGSSGASGGTAGTAGSPGTDIGAKP